MSSDIGIKPSRSFGLGLPHQSRNVEEEFPASATSSYRKHTYDPRLESKGDFKASDGKEKASILDSSWAIGSAMAAIISTGATYIQSNAAALGHEIEKKFADLGQLVGWHALNKTLNQKLEGDWKVKLAKSLVYLPMKCVVELLKTIHTYIKAVLLAIFFPGYSLEQAGNLLKNVLLSLQMPDTWTIIGIRMIGASLGSAAVGHPLSTIGIIIGTVATVSGLAGSAILKIIKKESALDDLKYQCLTIPPAIISGILMGLFVGGIQNALTDTPLNASVIISPIALALKRASILENIKMHKDSVLRAMANSRNRSEA